MKRSPKDFGIIALKGMAMGAADLIPGVSGGTIAFISGIYEEFIGSLKSINLVALNKLLQEGFGAFWSYINGSFLVALFAGILTSIALLANVISYLLENHPVVVWAFFFGLIFASIFLVGKTVKKWVASAYISFAVGTVLGYFVATLPPLSENQELWFVFISGLIAICAMILPGISGSFILVILGSYQFILGSIKEFNIAVIALFGIGCVSGLLSFSRLLSWLFKKHHDLTVSLLAGFLLGSLNKVWPWKATDRYASVIHSDGREEFIPTIQSNVGPEGFRVITEAEAQIGITEKDPSLMMAIIFAIVGLGVIFGLERLASQKS